MGEKNIKFVMVNTHHVHRIKKLGDNSPAKNDRKDTRIIAGLVKDGRYFYSYMRQICMLNCEMLQIVGLSL